jgi:hypothetical protein
MADEYKVSSGIKKMLKILIYKNFVLCISLWLVNVAIFSIVAWLSSWESSNNAHDIVPWIITSLSLCISSFVLLAIGCVVYAKTFRNKAIAIPIIIIPSILIYIYIYPFIYVCNYMSWNIYMYICAPVCTLAITIYYAMKSKRIIEYEFSSLYCIINNKLFVLQQENEEMLDKQKSKAINEIIKNFIPYLHWQICMALTAVAASIGMYAKSSHWGGGSGLAVGLCSLGLAFMVYPFFVLIAYRVFVVIPRLEKKFNQPLLSDGWGIIAQHPDLAEKFWGPNPVKRPIQYEEVFPKKQKT